MLCLSLLMASFVVSPAGAQAATTKKKSLTLYAGELTVAYDIGAMVDSAKSSNKKVVSVTMGDTFSHDVFLTAKKAGKATVTVKAGKGDTHKLAITVKKPDFDTDLILTESGIMATCTNNMEVPFESTVECTLRDTQGKVLTQKTATIKRLPGKPTYHYWWQSKSNLSQIDPKQSTVKVTSMHRYVFANRKTADLDWVIKDVSSKIKANVVDVTPEEGEYATSDNFKIKLKNTLTDTAFITVYILLYDEDNNLLRVQQETAIMLMPKSSDTVVIDASNEYDHYELIVYGYRIYKKK